MAVAQKHGDDREIIKGKHVLIGFMLFFGVIITVNFTMAWFAKSSWTGLVVKNSYVASQQYNERLEAAREQKSRGWKATSRYGDSRFELSLVDRSGRPVLLDSASARFGHPVHERDDHQLELQYQGEGLYVAEIPLSRGDWLVEIVGKQGDKPFFLEDRITVNSAGTEKVQE